LKSNFRTLLVVVLPLLASITVAAQTHRATLRGAITDPAQARIPGAAINLISTATGEMRSTTSNEEGEYSIPSIPAGPYQIEVSANAFATFKQKFELRVNEERRLDVTLQVGAQPLPPVDTLFDHLKQDTGSLGTVIENRQITGLPLDGRNF